MIRKRKTLNRSVGMFGMCWRRYIIFTNKKREISNSSNTPDLNSNDLTTHSQSFKGSVTKDSDQEDEEEYNVSALDAALSLRKHRKLNPSSLNAKSSSNSKPAGYKHEDDVGSPNVNNNNESTNIPSASASANQPQSRFIAPVSTPQVSHIQQFPTFVDPSKVEQKKRETEKSTQDFLNSIPSSLPKKPESQSNSNSRHSEPNLTATKNTKSFKFLPGSRIKLPPEQDARPEPKDQIQQTEQMPNSLDQSKVVSVGYVSNKNQTKKWNNETLKPRGLNSTDEEVKNFAVSGKIVEVDLRNRKTESNKSSTVVHTVPNKSTLPSSSSSSTHVLPIPHVQKKNNHDKTDNSADILAKSLDSIIKSADPSFLDPSYNRSLTNDKLTRFGGRPNQTNATPKPVNETEEDRAKRLRIEQARKMHENIERVMRQRDQRGGRSKGFNNVRKNQNQVQKKNPRGK